jgi:GNAT superfamily N-acetyltransferase
MDSQVMIRTATIEDLPALLPLLAQLDPDGTPITPECAQTRWQQLHACPGFSIRIAETREGPVGTFTILLMGNLAHGGSGTAIVDNVVVDNQSRGQGIGQAMMREAAALARSAGCYKIALTSGLSRTSAHRFYEELGFQRHGHSYLISLETP